MNKIKKKNAPKAVIAVSGGVDSGVSAALLKRAGFEVRGVFMKLSDNSNFRKSEKRAKKITETLKIPLHILNFKKEFKKRIVDYLLGGYKKGITPNPCVVCNKEIKFGLLLKKALSLGADFVATGHYARLERDKNGIHLLKGKDEGKDQSYFLWMLNQKQLKRVLFPVGIYTKKQVKKIAKKLKLPVSNISESQEICFVQTSINDFLKKNLKQKPGPIFTKEGKKVGWHQGLIFYTIGQRKGIGLSGGPYYVLEKDFKRNTLIVTKNEKDLHRKELVVRDVNWISGRKPKLPLKIKAKIRYRHQPASAVITKTRNHETYSVKFNQPQRAVTPGQSAVFYLPHRQAGPNQELLGGGIIC